MVGRDTVGLDTPGRDRLGRGRPARRFAGRRATALVGLVVLLAGACAGPAPEAAPAPPSDSAPADVVRPLVVATHSILGDVVGELIGDDLDLIVLMGPDVDPHDFALSAAEAARLRDAELVVANGLGLEPGLDAALDAAASDGVQVLRLAELVEPLPFADGGHAHDDDHGHDHGHGHDDDGHADDGHDDHGHGELDPHFWWDPARMVIAVEAIAAALAGLEGVDVAALGARTADYTARLESADAEMTQVLAGIPEARRRIVTNHDSLGYLAARFDLEVVATVVPGSSTQVASDAASFAALVDTVERLGIDVVFADNTDSVALAEQLASEVIGRSDLEVRVVRLATDALGPPGSDAGTYLGLLVSTARRIAGALA
jgi:zinc/manganese transport system substrate-binding protein